MNKSIFIGGTGRSGTTLVGNIISKYPKSYNFHETRFLVDFGGLNKILTHKDPLRILRKRMISRLTHICKNCNELKYLYTKERILDLFKDRTDLSDIIVEFFDIGLRHINKSVMIDKTPHNILIAKEIHSIFPKFKCIHVFRNPLDVYASVKPLTWGPSTVEAFIKWYNRIMVNAYVIKRKIPKKKYFIVKMEDLVVNPKMHIYHISKFLDISLGEKSINEINKNSSHINRFKEDLTNNEIKMINDNCKYIYKLWKNLYTAQLKIYGTNN